MQLVVVAAVAVAGIAIGRWGVPAEDAATVITRSRSDVVSSTDRFENMAEQKLAQMDSRDAGYAAAADPAEAQVAIDRANVAAIPASAVERKLALTSTEPQALSDAANVAVIPDSAVERKLALTSTQSPALSDAANVAPIPDSAVERKLALTSTQSPALNDAANVAPIPAAAVERKLALTSTQSPALSDVANVAPIPAAAVDRKLEQTGAGRSYSTADSTYDGMFDTKFAQMDARDAR